MNHIEKGLNPSSLHQLYFSGDNLLRGFKIGAVAGMIALTVSHLLPVHCTNIYRQQSTELFSKIPTYNKQSASYFSNIIL